MYLPVTHYVLNCRSLGVKASRSRSAGVGNKLRSSVGIARAALTTGRGMDSRQQSTSSKGSGKQRPYSAGNVRPSTAASVSGLRAVKTKPTAPAEAMFLGKEKSSLVLETGTVTREKVLPAGFFQSPTITMETTTQKSSAFTLLDNLHKMNSERLY